jgi:secreted trypsin-like serine protease
MVRKVLLTLVAFSLMACAAGGEPSSDAAPEGGEVGNDSDEVIGGAADDGDPAVVALFSHAPGQNQGSVCTATVISPTVLLTAAHCVDPASIGPGMQTEVIFSPDISRPAPGTVVTARETHFDPQFNINNLGGAHDIAVVILPAPTSIAPKPINRAPVTDALLNQPVRLVGYGSSSHRNEGAGRKRQATTRLKAFDANLLKIGVSGKQTCHGDSGGPAFMTLNGVETIVGVTSFGNDRSETDVCFGGGFDTRVDTFVGFVDQFL